MTLEPVGGSTETGRSPELIYMTRRFWFGAVLAVPTMILEMGGHFPGLDLHHLISPQASVWLQFALSSPVVLWAGWPFFVRGSASVRNRSLNMFSLIALGVGAAYLYSLASTVLPRLFPAALRQEGGTLPVYYEAAAVITVLAHARAGAGALKPPEVDGQRHSRPFEPCAEGRPPSPCRRRR